MIKSIIFKITIIVILVFLFKISEAQAYEKNQGASFAPEHLENYIQSPLNKDFEERFKNLFITKNANKFSSFPPSVLYYENTSLIHPEFNYNSPVSSPSKFLQITILNF